MIINIQPRQWGAGSGELRAEKAARRLSARLLLEADAPKGEQGRPNARTSKGEMGDLGK